MYVLLKFVAIKIAVFNSLSLLLELAESMSELFAAARFFYFCS